MCLCAYVFLLVFPFPVIVIFIVILSPPPLLPPTLCGLLFSFVLVREELRTLSKDFDKSEDDLKSLQSGVGQIVGEVLRQLTEDKCEGVVWQ